MKTLIIFQLISLYCSSNNEYSSKDSISSKDVISAKQCIGDSIIYGNGNPLDKMMDMPTLTPLPIIIDPKPMTNADPK